MISTHAPLAGRDLLLSVRKLHLRGFQPTRPLRGATMRSLDEARAYQFQPTRPLRGATANIRQWLNKSGFQPTRPLRGATVLDPERS